ncbi:hypothetical protein PMI22_03068 [Pseudomonas sp. GM21]|nr:hypothetical protein PMI22_03068 [Pseudomonas sp. GM21]MDR6926396.1 ABC-type phosphate transport system permease subunit [Pseudomonas sp. BE134]MDR7284057.1 ABC-type phosphate transport system permease subunit [Pseudomonas corrugata]
MSVIYGLYGLGYIIPATFLSQKANAQFHGQWLATLSSHFSGGLQPALIVAGSGLLIAGSLLLRPVRTARGLCANDGAPTVQR